MGNIKHHMGAIGGGINLSKAKTPQDSDIRYMPIDDRASSLSPLNQSGKQLRKKNRILNLSSEHKKLKDAYDSGQKVNENQLFNIEDRLKRKQDRYVRRYGNSPYSLIGKVLSESSDKGYKKVKEKPKNSNKIPQERV